VNAGESGSGWCKSAARASASVAVEDRRAASGNASSAALRPPRSGGSQKAERTLRLAEWDGVEKRPLQRAEEVGEQQVDAVEHEQRGGEARVRHGDVEGRGRSVFAKSKTDLHKCQASSGIC